MTSNLLSQAQTGNSVHVVTVPSYYGIDAQGYAAICELVSDNNSQGVKTILLDLARVDHFNDVNLRISLSRRIASLLNRRARSRFWNEVIALGGEVANPAALVQADCRFLVNEVLNCKSANDLLLLDIDNHVLGRSLFSWLTTFKARDSEPSLQRFQRAIKRQVRSYLIVRNSISELLDGSHLVEQIVVWNGRFPSWAGALSAAQSHGIELRFLENGIGPKPRYYLSSVSPHDVLLMQDLSIEQFRNVPQDQQIQFFDYLEQRKVDPKANEFIRGNRTAAKSVSNDIKSVTIFTSSNDEVIDLFLGRGQEGVWESQEIGISAVCNYLSNAGVNVTLRVHPNLLSKSWSEYNRVRRFALSLPAHVIGPASPVSSYELVEGSSIVVVWASTIGAEAIYSGVPTVLLSDTLYSRMADFTCVRCAEDLPRLLVTPKHINREAVLPYLFTLWRAGQVVSSSNAYNLWDSIKWVDRFNNLTYKILHVVTIITPWKSPNNFISLLSCLVGQRIARRLIDRGWS